MSDVVCVDWMNPDINHPAQFRFLWNNLSQSSVLYADCYLLNFSIDKLKCNCSCGPDGLPPILFRYLKHCLCNPLALMYNQLLSVGHVPCEWLVAHIVPVHKKGITTDVSNYRPILLTCVLSKILETIVVGRLSDHLECNNILHPAQHGFIKHRSTCTNLLESFNDWSISVQSKKQVQLFILISPKPLTWFLTRNCLPNYTLMVSVVMFYYSCRIFSLVHYGQKSTPVCLTLRT